MKLVSILYFVIDAPLIVALIYFFRKCSYAGLINLFSLQNVYT